MKTLLILIICFAGVFYLRKLFIAERHEATIVEETENNNIVTERSRYDVINDYFLLLVDDYLKKSFPDMETWEFKYGNNMTLKIYVNLHEIYVRKKDGSTITTSICTNDIWQMYGGVPSEEKKTDKKISPAEFMEKYAEEIEKTVKKAIKEGMGFFAYYEVKESVDSAFMEVLVDELEEMFGYDVSFKENVLEIGFQNAM